MPTFTDFDWLTTRERNLKKTKKDTRREMDIDVDAPPQETNKGYDMVGKQSPSDKMIISPTASRRIKMMPKWIEKAIGSFANKKYETGKTVTASENKSLDAIDMYLDKNRINLNEEMYSSLAAKAGNANGKSIEAMVKEVYDEAFQSATEKKSVEKVAGSYDYKFAPSIAKIQKTQIKATDERSLTIAELISDVAAKIKTEITSDVIEDVTKEVQDELAKKRHASNDDIRKIVTSMLQNIANKNIGNKLAHNGIRTTADQINLEAERAESIKSSINKKKEAFTLSAEKAKTAMEKFREAAEKIVFPKSKVTVQKHERMPAGYEKEQFEKGETAVTPSTKEATKLFTKILESFAEINTIEANVQKKIEQIKSESGMQATVDKMEKAVNALAAITTTANNNIVQIYDKAKAVSNYAILVTHENKQIQPTKEEIETEMKKKLAFFDMAQYEDMTKKLNETLAALKATKGYQLVEKSQPELKIVTKGSLNKISADEYDDLIVQIEALTKELELLNSVAESDLAMFEDEELAVAASVDANMEKKAEDIEKNASWKSTKPPKGWFDKKLKEVKEGNPSYTDEQASATVGKIWSDMSEKDRAAKRHSEGKEYGTPKKASLNKLGNDFMLRKAGFPDRYPYIDKCRNCAFFYSGLGTVYDKCVDCIHFYSEPELKDMAKEDISGLGDYFYDKSNKFNVGTPVFNTKHASLKVDAKSYSKLDPEDKKIVNEIIAIENEIIELMKSPKNKDEVNKKLTNYNEKRLTLDKKFPYQNLEFTDAVKTYMRSNR